MRTLILSTLIFVTFSFSSLAQNWLPLEVGNNSNFTQVYYYQMDLSSLYTGYSLRAFYVSDSTIINEKKYFYVNGFFDFPNNTLVRYCFDSSRVFIYKNGTEFLYMDFLLPDSTIILQIQPDDTFLPITIVSSSSVLIGQTTFLKGFSREAAPPQRYKQGWYYFAPDIGVAKQTEQSNWWFVYRISFDIIEFKYLDSFGNVTHRKHAYVANTNFNPITSLNFGENLIQNFLITHPYSIKTALPFLKGRTYISEVVLNSVYTNGIDTIFNLDFPINSSTEIDYSLNFPVNTSLYQQGYSLFYRIVAKDKGIVPSYYYKPTTGYYKLIYNPSPVQVLFSQDSIYVPTTSDTGSVKIVNTSEFPVRIDSIISIGSFYGYWGEFSKPGFLFSFYLIQTFPNQQWGDTLGVIIPPHDSINVSFSNVDLCAICDYEVQEYFEDTLRFVFTFMDGNIYSFSKSIPISGEGHPSVIEDEGILPKEFALFQNYPNPFNPSTKISWQSPVSCWQTLKVYDVLGKEVATLVNEEKAAGNYEVEFDASKFSSGVYFYQLRAGDPSTGSGQGFIETKKMILLK